MKSCVSRVVADVVEVGRDVDRPDVVEVVRHAEIEALDVDADAIRRGIHAVVAGVVVREIGEHLAADRGGVVGRIHDRDDERAGSRGDDDRTRNMKILSHL